MSAPFSSNMLKSNKNLLFFILFIIGFFWLWGALYYLLSGTPASASRPWTPWTIPVTLFLTNDPVFTRKVIFTGVPLALATLFSILVYYRERRGESLGDASFASEADIKKAKLRSTTGLILGKSSGKYLIDDGQTHVLVAAPTGSGKGVGIVIPNLLNWNGSAVVLDIKGENYQLTSGFRQKFIAFALYLIDHPTETCSIGNILRYLQTKEDTRDIVKAIVERQGEKLDPSAQRTFLNFAQQEKRMSESVKVGLVGALSLWNSPSIDAATSATDFDITSLRKRKTTIYVSISLADLSTIRPLLTLFFEQVFAAQLRKEPGADEPHKVLMLMDEFESLGTMSGIVDKLPFVRSFNIRVLAIIQGLSQLDQRYTAAGRDKILQASKHQIFFASNDQQTTNYVSQTLGKKTIRTVSKSRSRQGRTISEQQQTRDLLLPQEVRELSPDKLILITEGTRPIMGEKIKYFKDSAMKARVNQSPAKVPTLNLSPKYSPTYEEIAGKPFPESGSPQQPGGAKSAAPESKQSFSSLINKMDDGQTSG